MPENLAPKLKTFLVVPCFRESKRLPSFLPALCETVSRSDLEVTIQVVDDGSPGEEPAFLQAHVESLQNAFPFLNPPLLLQQNQGKGGAIRAGWRQADAQFDLLAFVDADGAVPASEVMRFLCEVDGPNALEGIHLAIRSAKAQRKIERTLLRKVVAKGFNWLIHFQYAIQLPDTQCGLKAVPSLFFKERQESMVQNGYAFDLELILAAKRSGLQLLTYPVDWREIAGGSTNARDALIFLGQLLRRAL